MVLLRGNGQGKNGGGEEPNKWLEETNSKLPMDPSGVMPSVAAQEARALDGDQTNETADVNDTLADGQDDGGATGTSDEGADGDAHHDMGNPYPTPNPHPNPNKGMLTLSPNPDPNP